MTSRLRYIVRHSIAAKSYLSEGECEKLIEVVRNFPVLWKTDRVDYGKRGPRFTAWKAVAKLMESNRGELEFSSVYKSRWMLLGIFLRTRPTDVICMALPQNTSFYGHSYYGTRLYTRLHSRDCTTGCQV